jgi:hypothetical protein
MVSFLLATTFLFDETWAIFPEFNLLEILHNPLNPSG